MIFIKSYAFHFLVFSQPFNVENFNCYSPSLLYIYTIYKATFTFLATDNAIHFMANEQ